MAETTPTTVDYGQPKDGITANTPKNILFGAGTIHKGLEFTAAESGTGGSWNFAESLLCATGDGNTLKIEPEITDIEVDGAWVKVEQLQVKTGETATMEITPVEITPEIMKMGLIAAEASSSGATGFTRLDSKERIEEGDYIDNLGYVGTRIDGTPIIIIFERALCTSGMEIGGANKEATKPTLTFECVASIKGNHRVLPYHIYYPTPAEG